MRGSFNYGKGFGKGKAGLQRCKALTPTDAAYIAGFIDGEGCIGAAQRSKTGSVSLHVSISHTSQPMLLWLTSVTGLGSPLKPRNTRSQRSRPYYFWTTTSAAAASLLLQIAPYLRLKSGHAKLFLDSHEALLADRFLLSNNRWRAQITSQFQKLNERGI